MEARDGKDFSRMDRLLEELRLLSETASGRGSIRGPFARALFNCARDADMRGLSDRGDVLLDELRVLVCNHPDDCGPRGPLARALLHRFERARIAGDWSSQVALLEESRELAHGYSIPTGIHVVYAKMLFRAVLRTTRAEDKTEADLANLDWLLGELRDNYRAARDSTDIQYRLSIGLENAAEYYRERGDLTRRKKLRREAWMVGWPLTSLRYDNLVEVGKPVDVTAAVYAWRMGKSLSLQLEPPPTYTWRMLHGHGGAFSIEGNRAIFRATEVGRCDVDATATAGVYQDSGRLWIDVVPPDTTAGLQGGGDVRLTNGKGPNPHAGVYVGTVKVHVLQVDGKKGDGQVEAALEIGVCGEGWVRGSLEHLGNPEFTVLGAFNGQVSGDAWLTARGMAFGIARSRERELHQWEEVSVSGEIGQGIFHGTISLVPGPVAATRQ